MHFLFNFLFVGAAIKWGDWKNWRLYYPTWLFFIGGDLFKNALLRNHRLWSYQETTTWGSKILIGHLAVDILIMLLVYPYILEVPIIQLVLHTWFLFDSFNVSNR